MGDDPDIKIAKFLARQAELEARRAAALASPPEWRWSRDGWGAWSGRRTPGLPAEPATNEREE